MSTYDPSSFKWQIRNLTDEDRLRIKDKTPDIDLKATSSLKNVLIFLEDDLIVAPGDGVGATGATIVVENSIESFMEHIVKMNEIDIGFEEWARTLNEYLFYKELELMLSK